MKITRGTIPMVLAWLLNAAVAPAEPSGSTWDTGKICAGQCLYTSLLEKQLPPVVIEQIVGSLEPHLNFKGLLPDTAYRYTLDAAGGLYDFTIESGPGLLKLTRTDEKYAVRRGPMHLSSQTVAVRGWYSHSSQTVEIPCEAADLSQRFAKILMKDLQVGTGLQGGDRFRLVVEKIHVGEQLLRYGPIEAFEFSRGNLRLVATRFQGKFYDDQGRALKSGFLKFPLDYQYISSQFHTERRHPVLGGVRPHRGVDFAAPVGTPVWSIADGKVKAAGWMGSYGQIVIVQHTNGYESLYAHLKEFAPKIREGAQVRQRQVIGFIGTTGLSTGSHLHYELIKDGEHRDPLKEEFPRPQIAKGTDRSAFTSKKESMASLLSAEEKVHAQPLEPGDPSVRFSSY